jgi:hypothetical protein
MRISIIYGYLLMVATTAVYCFLIWYCGNLSTLFPLGGEGADLPLFTALCISPLPLPMWGNMIHWQVLSILSLIFSIVAGIKRSGSNDMEGGFIFALILHTGWIVFAICCHMLGAIMPMISIGHIIK